MKTSLVSTTINIPELLLGYADNFEKNRHKQEVNFILVVDKKTPAAAKNIIDKIKKRGFETEYWSLKKQDSFLKKTPCLKKILPYNTDARRIIGILRALERKDNFIILIDDDNYVGEKDFLGSHSIVGRTIELDSVSSSNGWFNSCSMLKTHPSNAQIYHRGFPYSKRFDDFYTWSRRKARIVVSVGLWIEDPDLDAVSRLERKVKTISLLKNNKFVLEKNTFAPINSQNIAILSEALPAYYYVIMGKEIKGLKIDRYGDIWGGLFLEKIADHLGDTISFGNPLVYHRRNLHNLLNDLKQELWGMLMTEELVLFLEEIKLSKRSYADCFYELSDLLYKRFKKGNFKNKFVDKSLKDYFIILSREMKVWVESCTKILY